MIAFFKKRNKNSALASQKLHRRKSGKHRSSHPKFKLPLAAIFALGIALFFCAWAATSWTFKVANNFQEKFSNSLKLPPSQWQISVYDSSGNPVSDDHRKQIYNTANLLTKNKKFVDLQNLSNAISNIGAFERVSIVRPKFDTLLITTAVRKPIMTVDAGSKLRFLSEEGHIFGDASNPSSNTPLIQVNGLFEARTSGFAFDSSQKLILTDEETTRVSNAVLLWNLLSKYTFDAKALHFENFRGYSIQQNDGAEIILGNTPFEYKLEKLSSILTKLKVQGVTASRIELDYEGKAFIKEKKL